MPEDPLDGDDAAAGGDQSRGVEEPEIVQLHPGETRWLQRGAPSVTDRVLVRSLPGSSSEDPIPLRAVGGDVPGEQVR